MSTEELEEQDQKDESTVDASTYVVDNYQVVPSTKNQAIAAMVKPVVQPTASGRCVKVSKATVTAAKGRVVVAKKLGTQPSKATAKIAEVRVGR